MSNPFIGEIRMFAGSQTPAGWVICDGSLLLISENDTLFNLIGTTYGGDGQSTFALPDLRSRIPTHVSTALAIAQSGGVEAVALTASQMAAHSHTPKAQSAIGSSSAPAGNYWSASSIEGFSAGTPGASMAPGAIASAGGSAPHDNMAPFLAVNFILSLFGVYPNNNS